MAEIEDRFKTNLMMVVGNISVNVVTKYYNLGYISVHPSLIGLGANFLNNKSAVNLIEGFIGRSKEHWIEMAGKQSDFFKQRAYLLFGKDVDPKLIEPFTNLFNMKKDDGTNVLETADEKRYWVYVTSMLRNCIAYVHKKRVPTILPDGTKGYRESFHDDINLNAVVDKVNSIIDEEKEGKPHMVLQWK